MFQSHSTRTCTHGQVLRYSYEYWHEYWYSMVHLWCKGEKHTFEINSMTYHKGNVHTFFQFYHHWKMTRIAIFIFMFTVVISSKSSLSFNFWLIYEKFYFRLFSIHFMILHNFCFLFLNWQKVVNVSHDSQYVAKSTLKCHCIRLHRIIKQIYIDKDNLHGQCWAVGALSQVCKNPRTPLSETKQ